MNQMKRRWEDSESAESGAESLQLRLFKVAEISAELLQTKAANLALIQDPEEYLSVVRYQLESVNFQPVLDLADVADEEGYPEEGLVEKQVEESVEEPELKLDQWGEKMLDKYEYLSVKYQRHIESLHVDSVDIPSSISEWKKLITTSAVDLELLSKLALGQKFKLISLCQRWSSKQINSFFIRWIFITILVVPNLVSYSELAILRGFALKLAKLLPVVEDEQTKICYKWCLLVVGFKYGQRDLLKNYE